LSLENGHVIYMRPAWCAQQTTSPHGVLKNMAGHHYNKQTSRVSEWNTEPSTPGHPTPLPQSQQPSTTLQGSHEASHHHSSQTNSPTTYNRDDDESKYATASPPSHAVHEMMPKLQPPPSDSNSFRPSPSWLPIPHSPSPALWHGSSPPSW
jgi:hypothetical protein